MFNTQKRCMHCGYFKIFYVKQYACFEKQKCGLCRKQAQIKDANDLCENWRKTNNYKLRKSIALRMLEDSLQHITELKQIFAEEKEDTMYKTNRSQDS